MIDIKQTETNKKKGLLRMLRKQNAVSNIKLADNLGNSGLMASTRKFYNDNYQKKFNICSSTISNFNGTESRFDFLQGVPPERYKDLSNDWRRAQEIKQRRLTREEMDYLKAKYIEERKEPSEREKLIGVRSDYKLRNDAGKEIFKLGRELIKNSF